MDEEKRDQVSWNIAADQARHISELIKRGIDFYLKGNSGECYWTFTGIRLLINCELQDNEIKDLDKIEKEANDGFLDWEKYQRVIKDGIIPNEELEKKRIAFSTTIKKYVKAIMDFLKKLGYLPSKEDRTHLGF